MQTQGVYTASSTTSISTNPATKNTTKPRPTMFRRLLDPAIYPEVTIRRTVFFAIWIIPHVVLLSYYGSQSSKSRKVAINNGLMPAILFDTAAILVFMSPTFLMLLRRTFVPRFITLEKNVHAHKVASYTLVVLAAIHIGIQYDNFVEKSKPQQTNGKTVPGAPLVDNLFHKKTGWTGHVLMISLFLIIITSIRFIRRHMFEVFYFAHQLFVVFVVVLFIHHKNHMAYKYLSGPLALYVLDRTYRAIRSTFAKSPIRAVVQHPSGIVELQLDKRVFNHRVGQYVKIYCPSVSLVQWHPLTISSAPEEELLTVHFRLSGGWTARLAKRLGCNFDANPRNSVLQQIVSPRSSMAALPTPGLGIPYHLLHHDPSTIPIYSRAGGNSSYVSFDMTTRGGGRAMHGALDKDDNMKPTTIALEDTNKPGTNTLLELSRMESGEIHTKAGNDLPAIFIDGPYTAPSEHFFDYKVGVLIAAGIGVTPAAAILRSIYFRWLHSRESLETKKVYLFWVYRDIHTLEWFKDLLVALGEEGLESVVEVHTYFTGKIPEGSNSQLSPKGDRFGERIFDTPIGTTSYVGRPDFDTIFEAIGALHPDTSIGTFFSGPRPMLHTVRRQAHKWDSRLNKQTNTSIDFYSEKF